MKLSRCRSRNGGDGVVVGMLVCISLLLLCTSVSMVGAIPIRESGMMVIPSSLSSSSSSSSSSTQHRRELYDPVNKTHTPPPTFSFSFSSFLSSPSRTVLTYYMTLPPPLFFFSHSSSNCIPYTI